MQRLYRAVPLVGLLLPAPGFAAAPLFTDDAGTLPAHACQVEIWHDHTPTPTNWFLPACNVHNVELTLGALSMRGDAGGQQAMVLVQAKRNLLDNKSWGLAFGAGGLLQEHSGENPRLLDSLYAYAPLSVNLNDSLRMDLNAGWNYIAADRSHELTWGFAGEQVIGSRATIYAEAYGTNQVSPLYQLGMRFTPVKDHFQMFGGYGRMAGDQWASLGLILQSGKR